MHGIARTGVRQPKLESRFLPGLGSSDKGRPNRTGFGAKGTRQAERLLLPLPGRDREGREAPFNGSADPHCSGTRPQTIRAAPACGAVARARSAEAPRERFTVT